jgi:hypothetical protein
VTARDRIYTVLEYFKYFKYGVKFLDYAMLWPLSLQVCDATNSHVNRFVTECKEEIKNPSGARVRRVLSPSDPSVEDGIEEALGPLISVMAAITESVNLVDAFLKKFEAILSPVITALEETLVILESFVSVLGTLESPFEPFESILDGLFDVFKHIECPSAIGEFCFRTWRMMPSSANPRSQ